MVKELGAQQDGVKLKCDSTNHADVEFYRIIKLVSSCKLPFEKVHTSENAVDIVTNKFKHCLTLIRKEASQPIGPR